MSRQFRTVARTLGLLTAAAALPSAARATVVAYYNFNDASNPAVAADNSGLGHPGTVTGATYTAAGTAAPVDGGAGRAMTFNGGNHAVDVQNAAAAFASMTANNKGTVGLWIFGDGDQPVANVTFGAFDGGGVRRFQTHVPWSDQTVYFDTGGCCGADTRISKSDPDSTHWKGQWNQWTFIKDGDTKSIYLNGNLFHGPIGGQTAPIGAITQFIIGNDAGKGAGYQGMIDDFIVFDHALTAAQVSQLVTQGGQSFVPEPGVAGLVALVAGIGLVRRRRGIRVVAVA